MSIGKQTQEPEEPEIDSRLPASQFMIYSVYTRKYKLSNSESDITASPRTTTNHIIPALQLSPPTTEVAVYIHVCPDSTIYLMDTLKEFNKRYCIE